MMSECRPRQKCTLRLTTCMIYESRGTKFSGSMINSTSQVFSVEATSSLTAKNKDDTDDNNSPISPKEQQPNEEMKDGGKFHRDPLQWYGLLIPPPLRSSQVNFKEVVHNLVPTIVNVMMEIKEVEIDIRRTRKRISRLQ